MRQRKRNGQSGEDRRRQRACAMAGIKLIERAIVLLGHMPGGVMMRGRCAVIGLENGLDLVIAMDEAVKDRRQRIEDKRDQGDRHAHFPALSYLEQMHPDALAA